MSTQAPGSLQDGWKQKITMGWQASLGFYGRVQGLLHLSADQSRMLTVGAASSGGWNRAWPLGADTADSASCIMEKTDSNAFWGEHWACSDRMLCPHSVMPQLSGLSQLQTVLENDCFAPAVVSHSQRIGGYEQEGP